MTEISLELSRRKNQYGEYVIKCYKNGIRYKEGDYLTDDWNDAVNTLNFEAKRHKTYVRRHEIIYPRKQFVKFWTAWDEENKQKLINEFIQELEDNQYVNKKEGFENRINIDYVLDRLQEIKEIK